MTGVVGRPLDQRFKFTISVSISSAVEIVRELLWNPRWTAIIVTNSRARSTLDPSRLPALIAP